VSRIAESFADDVSAIGVHKEIEALRLATNDALLDLPFPDELSLGRDAAKQKVIDVGFGALDTLLKGGDPIRHVQRVTEDEAGGRLVNLSNRYGEWWDRHSPRLQSATSRMQDALFSAMIRISSEQSRVAEPG